MTDDILIAGGGIGGLTLAIALARLGIPSRVQEIRGEFPAEGAGIQLGPNATAILIELGLADALAPHVVSPADIAIHDGERGSLLNRLPLGDWMQERHGAPYWVVHRQDLLQALIAAAQALPEIEISLGSGVDSIKQGAGAVEITTTDGEQRTAALLVGADGLWSRVRGLLNPHFGLSYGGTLAARTVVERKGLKAPFNDLSTGVWLAPDAHVVHYPIDGGRRVAVVAIARGPEPAENWATPVSKVELTMRLMRLAPDLLGFLSQATEWRQWPLYSTPAVPTWADGRVLLLGDAAHPILPYLAQGGAMAIEDAVVLAAAIATHRGDPTLIAQHYLSERQQRTNRVRAASEQNGAAYHMRGIQAIGRNAVLRTTPAHLLMRRYDWIYGWRYQPGVHEVEL